MKLGFMLDLLVLESQADVILKKIESSCCHSELKTAVSKYEKVNKDILRKISKIKSQISTLKS